MNTTSVQINTQLYNTAVEYARRQHTSVEKMLEGFILSLPMYGKTEECDKSVVRTQGNYNQLSPIVERLGNLPIHDFSQEELDEDPRLAYLLK